MEGMDQQYLIIFTSVTLEVKKHQLASKSTYFPFSQVFMHYRLLADTI